MNNSAIAGRGCNRPNGSQYILCKSRTKTSKSANATFDPELGLMQGEHVFDRGVMRGHEGEVESSLITVSGRWKWQPETETSVRTSLGSRALLRPRYYAVELIQSPDKKRLSQRRRPNDRIAFCGDCARLRQQLDRLKMATRTSTATKKEITRKGDLVIVKVVETTTTYAPGKDPEVKEVTRIEEFKGEEGFKRLPEDIRRQLDQPNSQKEVKPVNKNATRGNFPEDCLAEHNKYRQAHGVQPLKLSKELIGVSQKRAKELADKDEMSSPTDHTYGENLSCVWSSDPEHFVDASEITARWYSEHKNYNFDEEPKDLNAGHFTQMIWASCKEFGIAAAKSDSNKIYVVASYSPPGNYVGEFKKNVPPAGSPVSVTNSFAKKLLNSSNAESTSKPQPKATNHSGASNISDLNKECVAVHNEYRAKHGVPPLRFSEEVAKYAQEWANELARQDKFEHRKNGKYGENLYCFKSSDPSAVATAADACKSWYSEIEKYNFNSEPKTLDSGHFTQMIWKTSEEVGMGRAKSKTGLQVIVANYNPPGNYVGTFTKNVPKPIK